jgi:hypothetical protein
MFYNDTCPFKVPEMDEDNEYGNSKVRWGIEGIPIVLFCQHDDDNNTLEFLGKYNFNLPKRANAPYGYITEEDESWEVQSNEGDNVRFITADFSGDKWNKNDFEARFPNSSFDREDQLKEFASWIQSTYRKDDEKMLNSSGKYKKFSDFPNEFSNNNSITFYVTETDTVDKYPMS